MKSLKHCIQITLLVLLFAALAAPSAPARAAVNGQQISVYACKAHRLVLRGYNQYGQYTTYALNKSASVCGWVNISNWWWKSYVYVTPYYNLSPSYQNYAGTAVRVYVPASQSSHWFYVSVPAPSTRQWMLLRAQTWVNDRVSYSRASYRDGYRKDCSGYVSFAWTGAAPGFATGTWYTNSYKIAFDSLQPGDALNSTGGGHMLLFQGWVNRELRHLQCLRGKPLLWRRAPDL